jgi:hypothetical protein
MTASALTAIVEGTRCWDWAYLRGSYRTNRKLYVAAPDGLSADGAAALRDPIRVRFPLRESFERVIDRELAIWSRVTPPASLHE